MGQLIDLDKIDEEKWQEETGQFLPERSKSQIKKDVLDITNFGKQLTDLSKEQLSKLPLDDNLLSNILSAKTMQKIALKRQFQFIGKLLRKVDNIEELQKGYYILVNKDKQSNLILQKIEHLRENLLNNEKSKETIQSLINDYPTIDIQHLRQLIRNHNKEVKSNKPKKSYRLLFQLLKEQINE